MSPCGRAMPVRVLIIPGGRNCTLRRCFLFKFLTAPLHSFSHGTVEASTEE